MRATLLALRLPCNPPSAAPDLPTHCTHIDGLPVVVACVHPPFFLLFLCADTNTPRTPAVAVATGSNVYVYRNLRPYFKFALPPVTIHATETSVWADVSAGTIDATKAVELLSAARCVSYVALAIEIVQCFPGVGGVVEGNTHLRRVLSDVDVGVGLAGGVGARG